MSIERTGKEPVSLKKSLEKMQLASDYHAAADPSAVWKLVDSIQQLIHYLSL